MTTGNLRLPCALIALLAACQGERGGLVIDQMTPEAGLRGTYVGSEATISFTAVRSTSSKDGTSSQSFHAEVSASDGTVIARMESDFVTAPSMYIGGLQVAGFADPARATRPTREQVQRLHELLESPAGVAFGELAAGLPWHVDGMHHEFLAIQTLYASLRQVSEAEEIDDGFSLEENAARVRRLTETATRPGRLRQQVSSFLPYPDAYICPGRGDKCTGNCGTGCQPVYGITAYTCECLRHDLQPNTADPGPLQDAVNSLLDPTKHKARTQLHQNSCSSYYTPQSPAYYCGAYGASEANSLSESDDGQWWCYSPYPGETINSPGPQQLQTDVYEHWNYGTYVTARAGTHHHFDQVGRIKMGIAGKASAVAVLRINPGSALCNQFGGTCEPNELSQVDLPNIEHIFNTQPGCWFNEASIVSGTSGSDGSTCPDMPFFHSFVSHGFGWYDAKNVPPGDYIVALVSKNYPFYNGHATANVAAYQGIGGFMPMKTGTCPAEHGNGVCDGGEYGGNAPKDCCDASTPCNQTYKNEGQLRCRNLNGQGYRWTSTTRYYCDESAEVGSSTYQCSQRTYLCSATTDQWSLVQQCGNGTCESSYGESYTTCSADCAPTCTYYCSSYGWPQGYCDGGWECTGTCIEYTGCYSGGGSCEYYCADYGAYPGQCMDGWECTGECIEYTGCY